MKQQLRRGAASADRLHVLRAALPLPLPSSHRIQSLSHRCRVTFHPRSLASLDPYQQPIILSSSIVCPSTPLHPLSDYPYELWLFVLYSPHTHTHTHTHTLLPHRKTGPVLSIHPLPSLHIRCGTFAGQSACGGEGGGGGGTNEDGGLGLPSHSFPASRQQQLLQQQRCGSETIMAAFAAAFCGDAARSVSVVRVTSLRPQPQQPHFAAQAPAQTHRQANRCTASGSSWSIQQLFVVHSVDALLPVPLPSALCLALTRYGADGESASGYGDSDRDEAALLVTPAAVMVLRSEVVRGSEGIAQALRPGWPGAMHGCGLDRDGDGGGGGKGYGRVWDGVVRNDVDMRMWNASVVGEKRGVGKGLGREGKPHTEPCSEDYCDGEQQQGAQSTAEVAALQSRDATDAAELSPMLGPMDLGRWRRALILPAEVRLACVRAAAACTSSLWGMG